MAQIYERQVTPDRTPMKPDTSEMQYFDKKRQASLDKIGDIATKTIKVEETRRKKAVDANSDMTKKELNAVIKIAKNKANGNVNKYNQLVNEGFKEIIDASKENPNITAIAKEALINSSVVQSEVEAQQRDIRENRWKTQKTETVLSDLSVSMSGLGQGYLSDAQKEQLTPEEIADQNASYQLSRQETEKNCKYILNAYDTNGRPLFSKADRAFASDTLENADSYALISYARNNIGDNPDDVMNLLTNMKKEGSDLKEKYSMNDVTWEKSINTIEKIATGQLTPEQQARYNQQRIALKSKKEEYDLKMVDGNIEIGTKSKANLTSMSSMVTALNDGDTQAEAGTDKEKEEHYNTKNAFNTKYVEMVESGAKVAGETWWDFGRFTAGEEIRNSIQSNLDSMKSDIMMIPGEDGKPMTEGEFNSIKAKVYSEAFSQAEQSGVDIRDKDNKDMKEIANNVALGVMVSNFESRYGKLDVAKDDRGNKTVVLNAMKDKAAQVASVQARNRVAAQLAQKDI